MQYIPIIIIVIALGIAIYYYFAVYRKNISDADAYEYSERTAEERLEEERSRVKIIRVEEPVEEDIKLPFDYEIILSASSASSVTEKYKRLAAEGREKGFTPVVIVLSDILKEAIHTNAQENTPDQIIKEAIRINTKTFLKTRLQEIMPTDEKEREEFNGEFEEGEINDKFHSIIDYSTKKPYDKIIIGKIPTKEPWEVAAWIPMGGFNDCPTPAEQVAIFKYWHEKYDVVPAAVTYDVWEMYTEKPIKDQGEAEKLALEHFAFCPDIVNQGIGKINKLAGVIIDSKVWFFWWD